MYVPVFLEKDRPCTPKLDIKIEYQHIHVKFKLHFLGIPYKYTVLGRDFFSVSIK